MAQPGRYGAPPAYPHQPYPLDRPWQPQRYDQAAHLRRLGHRTPPPGWVRPDNGAPPPRRPYRRPQPRVSVYAGLAAAALIAVGGTAYVVITLDGSAGPLTCGQQYAQWQGGPAGAGTAKVLADVRRVHDAAAIEDITTMDARLKAAGADAAALLSYPVPACADPAGYWSQALTEIKAAGDNATAARDLADMILAAEPLKRVPPLEGKLGAELERTTAQ
jgi:hypothetical protein